MAESVTLNTQPRPGSGSRATHKLRKTGLVPAIVYGHKQAAESVAITRDEIAKAVKAGNPIVELKSSKGGQTAQIVAIQWDHLGSTILHADFKRVDRDELIKTHVKLELRGTPIGIAEGGVLDQPIHVLDIECPVIGVPASIRADVTGLHLGQSLHVRELVLPEGVKALMDGEAVIAVVKHPHLEPEPGAAGGVEPEIITAKKPEEGEAEAKK